MRAMYSVNHKLSGEGQIRIVGYSLLLCSRLRGPLRSGFRMNTYEELPVRVPSDAQSQSKMAIDFGFNGGIVICGINDETLFATMELS